MSDPMGKADAFIAKYDEGWIKAGAPDAMETIALVDEIKRLRACLLVMSRAEVGGGSFRTAAFEVATTGVTADMLQDRFAP